MRHLYKSILLIFLAQSCLIAQRIENVKAVASNDKVVVTYDIAEAVDGQKFKVRLYGSHDNFSSPLVMVSGDVGQNAELLAGINKRIEWNAKSELKDYNGDITFEVRADIISAAVRIIGPSLGAKFKRGKNLEIEWKGIGSSQIVKLELLKGGYPLTQIGETSNRSNYTYTIPKGSKKGKDYQVRLTSNNATVISDIFTIKSRTPFIVKVLPVLVAGGVAAAVLGGGGTEDKGPTTPTGSSLPEPPGVPNN
jgi:hypothetical protein